jgi:hypothetical protein
MAARYWVGGTGTWDASSTTHWSASSGGASGASAPTSADTVIIDSLSGTGTCTTASGATCAIATLNSSTLGLTLGANLTMSGTFTLTLGALSLGSNTLTCSIFTSNNSNTRSIAFSTGNITVTGSNATIWNTATGTGFSYTGTPTVNFNYSGSTGTRTIAQAGSGLGGGESTALNMNFSAGSDTITFGGASRVYRNLNFTGFSGTYTNTLITTLGNIIFSSGMVVGSGANAVTFGSAINQQNITSNGQTLDFPLTFNGVGGTFQFQDALTQGSTQAFVFANGTVQFKSGVTSTVGSFVTSGTNQKYLQSSLAGSQFTLSQTSGTVSASYVTIRDSIATGGATWIGLTANNAIDAGNNSGWFFDAPFLSSDYYGVELRSFTERGRY